MLTTRPRGTNDILPGEAWRWRQLEKLAREICALYGFREVRTPVFEHTELFQRGVGETTDIVEKEMYTFLDRGERSITLRPEGTAPAVRALLENRLLSGPLPVKLFYTGPMFRYDRPQAGRFRQFHQFGVEAFGSREPALDAEVIALAMDFYKRLGLKGLELHVNSVGCPACRPAHREKLQAYLEPVAGELCPACRDRLERNPMRILDCKNPACQAVVAQAPTTAGTLCPECAQHYRQVLGYLADVGIEYVEDKFLVRGLDYYTNTTFEIMVQGIGAQGSIGAGGRYDGLVEQCGGPPTPGVGFGLGLERVLLTMEKQVVAFPAEPQQDVFVATAGPEAEGLAFAVLQKLRAAGLAADKDYQGRSLKAQFKHADRLGVTYTIIIGAEELSSGTVKMRNMRGSSEDMVKINDIVPYLEDRLAKATITG